MKKCSVGSIGIVPGLPFPKRTDKCANESKNDYQAPIFFECPFQGQYDQSGKTTYKGIYSCSTYDTPSGSIRVSFGFFKLE